MKTSEVIERLEVIQTSIRMDREFLDALAIAIEILKRMEADIPKRPEKMAGTPLKGSGA